MFVRVLAIFVAVTVIQGVLIDDARSELEIAKNSLIQAINTGHIVLDDYYEKFITYSFNVETEGQLIIEYEDRKLKGQVEAIEEEAESSKVNVSVCLDYEDRVQNITTTWTSTMKACILVETKEAAKIVEENNYLIDISVNRVYNIEYQLGLCEEDNEDCIMPIYERILNEKQYGAESIEVQQIKVNNLLNQLKPIVQDCSNLNVSQYENELAAILQEISQCADARIQ